ncbi:MAG: DUF2442 domain-containing protein [Planctomycetes bacterium]|nr:DUF2442 domain-containing protein [Planctomycetota bacterium]
MEHDVITARPVGSRRLRLKFRDGAVGEVDVTELVPFEGVFAPLADDAFFARVSVHAETFTVMWPNGADLDSDVLYAKATGATDALPGVKRK